MSKIGIPGSLRSTAAGPAVNVRPEQLLIQFGSQIHDSQMLIREHGDVLRRFRQLIFSLVRAVDHRGIVVQKAAIVFVGAAAHRQLGTAAA